MSSVIEGVAREAGQLGVVSKSFSMKAVKS